MAPLRTVYIAGHTGLVGSALLRHFTSLGARVVGVVRGELDLTRQAAVEEFLHRESPDAVIVAAGRVGGIQANASFPAQFIYENVMIEANLIHASWKAGVKRLLNFGSSCMFPKICPQPMELSHLMAGRMEPTSEPYAIAKWAGLSMCRAYNRQYGTQYLTAIPCTLFGPGDSFHLQDAHVISALLRKFHEVKRQNLSRVVLWGTGRPRREFLYVEDLARACELLLALESPPEGPILIGSGRSYSIHEIAQKIAGIVGFQGEIAWDPSQPDGAPEKLLDSTQIRRLGWIPRISFEEGISKTYRWFLENEPQIGLMEPSCAS